MSSLQVGLAVAGGLILGGVIAYNTWNARRHEPRQAQPEAPAPTERVEPGLLGGLVVRAHDRKFDTSLRSKLDRLRDQLSQRTSQEIILARGRAS